MFHDDATDIETLTRIQQLYGAQSHFIDEGDEHAWARTFTDDGEFHSPSYATPVRGRTELAAFAARFVADARARDEITRHVITNVFVQSADERSATVRAYLQIVTTPRTEYPRLVRLTTITDELIAPEGRWRIQRRTVRRDDTPR